MITTLTTPPQSASPVPSKVFPLPGWTGPINTHWGQGINGGSDLMVSASGVQPVVSMVSGKVSFTSSQGTAPHSGGNAVTIHGIDGLDYYYAHLAAPLGLKPGDSVAAGQQLGFADSTGDAAGGPPHLHIGIGHGIQTGVGATGGTGIGFDAVASLRALVGSPSANNPQIVSPDTQRSISTSQPAGTIMLNPGPAPQTQSLQDRILWLAGLLAKAGVPTSVIPMLTAISLAENGASDPGAVSSTSDVGLWQINIPVWAQKLNLTPEQLKDPATNAWAAYQVYKAQGLSAWATFNKGLQNKFLPQVQTALSGVTLPSGDGSTPSGGGPSAQPCDCGVWLRTPFGDVPDLGCVFMCQIGNIIQEWKTRWLAFWDQWKHEHIANIFFVVIGVVLMFVGAAIFAGGNSTVGKLAETAAGGKPQ